MNQLFSRTSADLSNKHDYLDVELNKVDVFLNITKTGLLQGKVISTNGQFRMPSLNSGELKTFAGIEIRTLSRIKDSSALGTFVTSIKGKVLGIIICGAGNRYYAAPLSRLLKSYHNLT